MTLSFQAYTSEVNAYLSLYGNLHTVTGRNEEMFVAYGYRTNVKPKAIASIIARKNCDCFNRHSLERYGAGWENGTHLARHLMRLTTLANNRLLDRLYAEVV